MENVVPKFIIFCADWTWNGPIDASKYDVDAKNVWKTNVYKLFANLKSPIPANSMADEQERPLVDGDGNPNGIVKYLHGVGDSRNPIVKILGGTVGAGLISRVMRGYTFISRHYEVGDEIIITGFSRGAYTARALAGLIAAKGLLDSELGRDDDKAGGYRAGIAVWSDYQAAKPAATGHDGFLARLAGRIVDAVADIEAWRTKAPPANDMVPDVPMAAVAVWDTVGAMGVPLYTDGGKVRQDVFGFTDNVLSAKVARGFHAVAVDEQRVDFTPSLWEPAPHIEQVLFPGAHSDVGGGYPLPSADTPVHRDECGLSDRGLQWMMGKLESLGVVFDTSAKGAFAPKPDVRGMGHEPWRGSVYKTAPRGFPAHATIDISVTDRMNAGPVGVDPAAQQGAIYAPMNLPVLPVAPKPSV